MYSKYVKRFLDVILSIVLILVLWPLFIIVGLISKITTGNIIYKQNRDGFSKKSFVIYKFQSMLNGDEDRYKRTPKIMRYIRALGLDELPQLINILKGDMSFVGPRPFITGEELPIEPEPIIYTMKPGVISLAVANGRRKISYKKRLKYDYIYATNVSFKLDVYIIFKTLVLLIKQNIRGESWKK
ncbi:MAG: sugar transferase [Firmicutes bacterium]|nr:sugar transferase [Bacillota bacterium]